MNGHWTDRAPRSLIDPVGPRDEPVMTPMDRRWLWRIEALLVVDAPMGSRLDCLASDLRQYLNESCEHHWLHSDADELIPEHNQCLWCNDVDWLGEAPDA